MALTKVIGNGLGATQEGAITFNEGSADVDFRVESNGNTHMLFVQAGSDCLGIKTASPNDYYADDLVLTVPDEGGMTIVQGTSEQSYLAFADGNSGDSRYRGYLSYDHGIDSLYLGTSANVGLKIDSTGAVTKPLQPAFCANLSSTYDAIPASSNMTIIPFATERFDQNADFNTSNYTFTAPVTGRYLFTFMLYLFNSLDTSSAYYYVSLNSSNRDYDIAVSSSMFGADISLYQMTGSVIADMDASDTMHLAISQSSGAQQCKIATTSSFSGALIC